MEGGVAREGVGYTPRDYLEQTFVVAIVQSYLSSITCTSHLPRTRE